MRTEPVQPDAAPVLAAPRGAPVTVRFCEECGQPFYPGRRDQNFCRPVCRQAHHRRRCERGAALYDFAMAGSVNKVILIGNLGRDPEIRHNQDGGKIATLNLATSESWKDRSTGERREKTEWHRVVIFNEHLADLAENYLRKGSKVYVEGALQTRKWTDQSGAEKYTTEVVIGRFKGELTLMDSRGNSGPPPAGGPDDYGTQSRPSNHAADPGLDDEIPF